MHTSALGICLNRDDPSRIGEEVIEILSDILPFTNSRFIPCEDVQEAVAVLDNLPLSSRQRERAREALLQGKGFWDRIAQMAIVPLLSSGRERWLGLYEFSGVPKDMLPRGSERSLMFMEHFLRDRLFAVKLSRALSSGQEPPEYVRDIVNGQEEDAVHLLQASFYQKMPALEDLGEILHSVFPPSSCELAGRSCSTLWFHVHPVDSSSFSSSIRKIAMAITDAGWSFKSMIGHVILPGMDDVRRSQSLSAALKTAVFFPAVYQEIFEKTGVDLRMPVFNRTGSRSVPGTCCMMIKFESMQSMKKAEEFLLKAGQEYKVFPAGSRNLALFFNNSLTDNGFQELEIRIRELFQQISSVAGSNISAGFASTAQPYISRALLPFSGLLALVHACLLGSGQMAVFDHVTHNVHGDLLISWGDIPGACAAYRRGLKLEPADTNILNSLGVCLARLRRFKDARNCFQQVLQSEPDNFMALYNLAGIHLDSSSLEEASSMAQKALSKDPHNHAAIMRLANCWIGQKRFQKALDLLMPEITGDLDVPVSMLRLAGRAALEAGDWARAREILGRCLKKRSNDPECLSLLAKGYILFEQDRETADRLMQEINNNEMENKRIKRV